MQSKPLGSGATLLHVGVLIAATAVASATTLILQRMSEGEISWSTLFLFMEIIAQGQFRELSIGDLADMTTILVELSIPFLMSWTLALAMIGLTSKFLARSCTLNSPGVVATFAASTALLFVVLHLGLAAVVMGTGLIRTQLSVQSLLFLMPFCSSLAISSSWLTLLLNRQWHAEDTFVGRLGRLMGYAWVLVGLTFTSSLACTIWYSFTH